VSRAVLALLALLALLGAGGVTSSGADFTATTSSPANAFATAADFNTVAVALTNPGTPLRAEVTLQATAGSDQGIQTVRFESSPAGASTWTLACQSSSTPAACTWDSAAVADGPRDLRAVATDAAGYQRASAVVAGVRIDNTQPAVTLDDPGHLTATETLTATGSDAGSGLDSLAIAYRPAGSSWTTLCSGAGSPRSCAFATGGLPDGSYELRARATDLAGNMRDTVLSRTLDNTAPTVAIVQPAGPLRGTVALQIDATDGAGSGLRTVTAQIRAGASGAWSPLCTDQQCAALDTTQVPDGPYEARAIAEDEAGLTTTSSVITGIVDNTAPATPTLNDPGANLEGSVSLSGTAADTGSGIAAWIVQYRPAGSTGAWTDACSDTTSPFTCAWDTTGAADALYDVRAVARDRAGNEAASATRANRRVDNSGPTVALADPGAYLRGTVALSATASDPAGVQSVIFERRAAGGTGSWTAICTDTGAPYTCSFNTSTITDGSYDLRARAVDTMSHSSTSTASARLVDNTTPAASAVDSGNGGATPGRLEAGDWLRLTWTEPIAPGSVLAGWDGSAVAIRAELQNSSGKDEMDFWNAAGTTHLNIVDDQADLKLNANYVTTSGWFNATMTRSGAAITVTLGTRISGTLTTATAASIAWKPSILATDLAGNASTAVQVSESGATDVDF
jgi:hypothetical protein